MVIVSEIWCTCAACGAGDKQWEWTTSHRGSQGRALVHIAVLTRKVHVNMSDVMGLASATHIRSAVSPRFTSTGSFCGWTPGESETKKRRQNLRQKQRLTFQYGTNDLLTH